MVLRTAEGIKNRDLLSSIFDRRFVKLAEN
jgi:hypothetical protein